METVDFVIIQEGGVITAIHSRQELKYIVVNYDTTGNSTAIQTTVLGHLEKNFEPTYD